MWRWMAPRSTGLSSGGAVIAHSGWYMYIKEMQPVRTGARADAGPARPPQAAHSAAVGPVGPLEPSGALTQTTAQRGKILTFAPRFLPLDAVLDERSRWPVAAASPCCPLTTLGSGVAALQSAAERSKLTRSKRGNPPRAPLCRAVLFSYRLYRALWLDPSDTTSS